MVSKLDASDRVEITIPMINLGEDLMNDEISEMVASKIANAEKIAMKMEAGPLNEDKEQDKFYDPWCNCCNQPEPTKDENNDQE